MRAVCAAVPETEEEVVGAGDCERVCVTVEADVREVVGIAVNVVVTDLLGV